jgi:hypothetical protein
MGPQDEWQRSRTSIDFRMFGSGDGSSPVLSMTRDGHPDVLKRYRKKVQVQHSVLPPTDPSGSALRYFHHEYGHDFNANGCFDEFGHNKLMLPVVRDDAVVAFLFLEYTTDELDGVPMLSVGRYFRRH